MSKITKRITAMLLAGMLVIGSAPGSAFAASTDVDPGQTSEIAEEVYEEDTSEVPASERETAESDEPFEEPASVGETAEEASAEEEAQYYTVTLDANGGYFENEWDDSIGDFSQQVEVVEKHIPVDGAVAAFPVFNDPDGQAMLFAGWSLERDGELVSKAEEEYIPVDNCVLYAVWRAEDAALVETEEQEVADEGTEQADSVQKFEEFYAAEESADAVTSEENPVEEEVVTEFTEDTSDVPVDAGNMSQVENTSEAPAAIGETAEEASAEEEAQYYTVTLDANGGYFENEWDDAIGDYAQQAEVVEKHIPVDGTVTAFPVFTDQDGQTILFAGWSLERDGELISQAEEEYIPVDNCVLYAVWWVEDAALGGTGEQEVAEENSEQVNNVKESDSIQYSMKAGAEGTSDIATDRQYSEYEQIDDPEKKEFEDGIEEVTSEQNINDGNDDDPQDFYPLVTFEEEEILAVAGYNKYLKYSVSNFEGEYLDYELIWKSSRTDIALISSEGYLRPLRAGETIVSLSVDGTDIGAFCKVTVADPEKESEYHLTKNDFEDVQEAEPGLIVGGLRKNIYGNVVLLPGKYIINEDICLDDMEKFYYEDNGEYSFSGEGSFYDSRIGDDGNWSTGTANYTFEDFTLNNVYISCYGIKIKGGNYKDLTLDIENGTSMNNPGIYGGYFEGLYVWNNNDYDYDNIFTIDEGEFLNGTISGRGGDTDIIGGSFKDVCIKGCCSIYGGVFVTEKEDYAIMVGWDVGPVYVYGGYFKGKIAAANSMHKDRLYLRGGTFENGQVGAVIIPTGYSSHQEAGKTIKKLLEPYEFKNAEYFEIVMDGDYYDVAKGIDGSVDIGFNIENYDVRVTDAVYTGQNIIPEYRIFYPENTYYPNLTFGTDYELKIENNLDVGVGKLTITGKGEYFGTITSTFKIKPAPISNAIVTGLTTKTYNGAAHIQSPIVKMGSTTLKENSDYNIDYSNNINAGRATIMIVGIGRYTGSKNISFMINKAAQSITAKAAASPIAVGKTTTVSITGNKGTKSFKSSDTTIATVSSTGKVTAKKVGKVTITATSAATANYKAASKTITIKVVPAATSSLTVENQATGIKLTWKKVTGANAYFIYRGSTQIAAIKNGSTVTYTDKKATSNGTKYTYKIVASASATGRSTLSKSVTTYCVARPAISTLTNSAASKMTVKWGKNAKATGYQIQYCPDKTFKTGNKSVSINSASTVSKVIGSLAKGKIYYVRIRSFKTVGSTKYFSAWSSVKSVKISK